MHGLSQKYRLSTKIVCTSPDLIHHLVTAFMGSFAGDEPALLNWEGLAELLAFQGHAAAASSAWQAGSRGRRLTSRYLRQWALAKKKREGDDAAAATLFSAAVRANPQVRLESTSMRLSMLGCLLLGTQTVARQQLLLLYAPNAWPCLWVSVFLSSGQSTQKWLLLYGRFGHAGLQELAVMGSV